MSCRVMDVGMGGRCENGEEGGVGWFLDLGGCGYWR